MKRAATILIMSVFLAACVSSPVPSLDQRLAGKSQKEARNILAYACYREAIWPLHHSAAYLSAGARQRSQMDNDPGPEYRELSSLCADMRVASDEDEASLAKSCETLIQRRSRKYGAEADDHIRRVGQICRKFTRQSIDDGRVSQVP